MLVYIKHISHPKRMTYEADLSASDLSTSLLASDYGYKSNRI